MNLVVIGLGSMGKRRIRLIQQIDKNIGIVGADSKDDRRSEAEKQYGIKTSRSIDEALELLPGIRCAIVSTSPLSHAEIINECLSRGLNVFTELNLTSERYEENVALANEKGLVLFLSSTFLYRPEVQYIQKRVKETNTKISYSYHVGQYLPDWHPWENYKDFFVGNKKTNGCREIMAIEFPWLISTFGKIKHFMAMSGNISELDIDYPDTYKIIIRHDNGVIGSLDIDIVSRKAVRNLEVYGENLYISWDGTATGLKDLEIESKENKTVDNFYKAVDHQIGYSSFVVENAYKSELSSFFDQIEYGTKPIYTFRDDLNTLEIIDEIEQQVLADV